MIVGARRGEFGRREQQERAAVALLELAARELLRVGAQIADRYAAAAVQLRAFGSVPCLVLSPRLGGPGGPA